MRTHTLLPILRGVLIPGLAALLAMALPSPSTAQEYGTIKGQVVWAGEEVPDLPPKVAKGDQNAKDAQVCAAEGVPDDSLVVDADSKGVRYVLVYLVRPKGENPEAVKALVEQSPEVEVDQIGCRFVPHVTALHENQKIVFKSSDPIGHNVRLTGFSNPAMNIMLPPKGNLEKELVSERRPMPLTCDIHPWMQGYVMVFDHPFFAVTDEQGNFEIKGVPPGEQNIVVWHEKVGYVTPGGGRGFTIPVEAGKETKVGPIKIEPDQVKE